MTLEDQIKEAIKQATSSTVTLEIELPDFNIHQLRTIIESLNHIYLGSIYSGNSKYKVYIKCPN